VADEFTVKLVPEVVVSEEASVTTTLWAPWGTMGIVKLTVDDPLAPEVPPDVIVAETPPTVTVNTELAANPWAVICALAPTTPFAGLSPVAEALTVKLVAEVALLAAASDTTTVWGPLGSAGMVKFTVAEPVAPVVPPEVIVAFTPPTLTVKAELGANP
jgi:hypothetical protein